MRVSSVLFPAPFGPTRWTISPARKAAENGAGAPPLLHPVAASETTLLRQRSFNRRHQLRIVRRHIRREALNDVATAIDEEFFEVPQNVVHIQRRPAFAGHPLIKTAAFRGHRFRRGGNQFLIERRAMFTVDVNFAKQREGDAVGSAAEGLNLSSLPGSAEELVAGEPQHAEALGGKLLLQILELLILRRQAAFRGYIDDQ